MRTTVLILVLTTLMVVSSHAQYHGRCGSYRYTIDGKLISNLDIVIPGSGNDISIKSYYKVDTKNGYIWFWIEETKAGSNSIAKFTSLWSRLSELNAESFSSNKNNPVEVQVQLSSSQQFFFTTVYYSQKKGPQYEVRNKLSIRFNNEADANAFIRDMQPYIPGYK